MKTCLFGGTFDPPHFGHLIVAQTIFEAEHFDKIVFVPAHIPPHKMERKISSVSLRLDMLTIATMGDTVGIAEACDDGKNELAGIA